MADFSKAFNAFKNRQNESAMISKLFKTQQKMAMKC